MKSGRDVWKMAVSNRWTCTWRVCQTLTAAVCPCTVLWSGRSRYTVHVDTDWD